MAQSLDTLKQKYQPVIDEAKQIGIHLQNVNMQGDKLFIRGEAPSQEIKNQLWNRIKAIDSTYSDLTADITINSSLPQPQTQQQPTMSAGASASGGESVRTYTVQAGDTLSKISQQFYGNSTNYMQIFEANRDQLKNPDQIRPGQTLKIPNA
jgi:nucleoid-associated protein YgaU